MNGNDTYNLDISGKGRSRTGTATLELVLSMPILLALIIGIFWLGSSVIAQTEVTVEARHKTWSKRNNPTGTGLLFLKDDTVTDKATEKVNVSPLFDEADSPESSHIVMAGPWDFEKLPLDNAPNWKQYLTAAVNAKTGGLQNGYVDGSNKLTQFKSQAGNIWKTLGADMIRQLTGLGGAAESALDGGQSDGNGKESQDRDRINQELDSKKQELSKAREELDDSSTLKEFHKNRIKRLEAEVKDLESELKAME